MLINLEAERGRLVLFLILHMLGGHIGMPLVLLTIFASRQIMRHPVFINFCITWTCFSSSYLVLLYAGQIENLYPPFLLCLTQAAMIYASGAMIGVSSFLFMLHLFFVLRGAVYPNPPLRWHTLRLVAIIGAPYLAYVIVFTTGIVSGYSHQQLVHRSSFYCTIKIPAVAHLGSGIAAAGALVSIVTEIFVVITLYRHWKTILDAGVKNGLNLSLVIRASVFTVCGLLALLTCVAILDQSLTAVTNIVIACLPMVAVLIFGSQTDLLRAWCFWRKEGKTDVHEPALDVSTTC